MAKYKCTEKAILKATGKEIVIDKVITDYGTGITKYELNTGEKVSNDDLLKLYEVNNISDLLHKSVKKGKTDIEKLGKGIAKVTEKAKDNKIEKISLTPVEKSDQPIKNQEVEKSDFSKEKR